MFWLLLVLAAADPRSEDDMFGEPASEPASAPAVATTVSDRDEEALKGSSSDGFLSGRIKEDFLKVGGRFYLRTYSSFSTEQRFEKSTFNVPALVDAYLDARPMDRLRAQITGRLQYDPFLNTSFGGVTIPGATAPANPSVGLDQAWIAFDIARTVFITAGRQHVKWGTSRIFNPTDFLSAQFRDPLAQFDARLGVTMLKISVPWEAKGWNFYAVALFEPTQRPVGGLGTGGSSGSTMATALTTPENQNDKTIADIGGAARAEFTFGNTQIAIDGLIQRNRKARAGLDFTTGIGPIDIYGEVAVRAGTDIPLYRLTANADPSVEASQFLLGAYEAYNVPVAVGASGGISYDLALPNKRALSFGGEYFFNSAGYDSWTIYQALLIRSAFQPFYNGKHYGAVTMAFIDNGARLTAALSNIGNFSDMSFISRLDVIVTVFNYLSVEAFVSVHYGQRGGEFRFATTLPAFSFPGLEIPASNLVAPLIDAGLGLRMSL